MRDNLQFYEDLGLPVSEPNIAYQLKGAEAGDTWSRIIVLINPRKIPQQFVLPPGEDVGQVRSRNALVGRGEDASRGRRMSDALLL